VTDLSTSSFAQEDYLPFRMPDFTRTCWVSDVAKKYWEPAIRRVSKAWRQVELLSVAESYRAATLVTCTAEEMAELPADIAHLGLSVIPVQISSSARGSYSTRIAPLTASTGRYVYHCAVGRLAIASAFSKAWRDRDDETIGLLLGFPSCCRKAFTDIWVRQNRIDTTWHMAVRCAKPSSDRVVYVEGYPEANVLLRWLGVRAVPHLPCSFDCPRTALIGRDFLCIGETSFTEEMALVREMIEWPVEWSALHGIAEIKTPVIKLATNTDSTGYKYVVRRKGSRLPEHAARGLSFPYPSSKGVTSDLVRIGAPDVEPALRKTGTAEEPGSLNGFGSHSAMLASHAELAKYIADTEGDTNGAILDLGCGDGAFVSRLARVRPGSVPFGVDIRADEVARAQVVLEEFGGMAYLGNICNASGPWLQDRHYELTTLMVGVLLEMNPVDCATLLAKLRCSSRRVLYYAYSDYSARYTDIAASMRRHGITWHKYNVTPTAKMFLVNSARDSDT
jgi:2-polyprenyl-3-methyl-5-hydroxy-6-metoxy-1,4-benzoquinol methylase